MKCFALCALALLPSPVLIPQDIAEAPAVQEVANLESPRETLRTLIEGVRERGRDGFDRAVKTLDLSWVPKEERKSGGTELAQQLKEGILDRLDLVDYGDIPDPSPVQTSTGRFEWVHGATGGEQVTLVFQRNEPGWQFEENFVRSIPELAKKLRGLGISADVRSTLTFAERMRIDLRAKMPPSLLGRAFILENWQWLALLVLIFVGVVADRIVRFFFARLAKRISGSNRLKVDKDALTNFERPFGIFVTAGLFVWLLPIVGIEPSIERILDLAASVVLTISGIWAMYRLVDVLCGFLAAKAEQTTNKFDDMLVPLMRRTLKILISVIGLVFIASRLSEDVWHILAGLSIGSLAVGFAAKDSIENLFGTFTVLMDKPFQLGDWITVGDIDGSVEEVGFRSTRVRTFYNSVITVPNSRFISAHVDNMGERLHRRVKTMLSLTYDTPPEKIEAFCEGVRELLRQHPYTRKDTFYVYLNAFAGSSVDVLLYAFLTTPDWGTELREKHRLYCDILRLAEKLEVDFAFPTQTIHVAKPEDLEHPGAPDSPAKGVDIGREVATQIAEAGLSGFDGKPPVFDMRDLESQAGTPRGR